MSQARLLVGVAVLAAAAVLAVAAAPDKSPVPENLARRAAVTATSTYSAQYEGRLVADGIIPALGSRDDIGKAWCVDGATYGGTAELVFTWPDPVTVAEIVYYGRTSFFAEECWKDCEVLADSQQQPVARSRFRRGHGAQRVRLAHPVITRRLTLRFLSAHGPGNPGANEVQIYASSPPDDALPPFEDIPSGATQPTLPHDSTPDDPALMDSWRSGRIGIRRLVAIQRKELNPSHVYTYHMEDFQPGGGLWSVDAASGAKLRLVDSPDGQILDCDVSYDGSLILFSWRKTAADAYHVYTVKADGSRLTKLTDGQWHDYNACWLPDGGIAFLSTRSPHFAYCWISPVGLLYRMNADGSGVRRLSANIVNDFTPSVMADGRLIYSRWEYVDRPAIPIQSLWTINPDGTGLSSFYGNRVLSPATFMEARQIPGTPRVLCVLTSHNGPARGALGVIDPTVGVNAQEAIENLTPEVDIGKTDRGDGNAVRGPYESPYPLDSRHYLCSARGTVLLRSFDAPGQARLLQPDRSLGWYSAKPLEPRRRQAVITSRISKVVPQDDDHNPTGWATLVLQDVYRGLGPSVRRGDVKRLAVVEELNKSVRTSVEKRAFGFQFPVISCGATYAAKKVWGFVDVSADGSARFQAPSGRPIYFLALDAQGRTVQRMRTFTHLMPGERQACVGCHDHGNRSPQAAFTSAARAQAVPLRRPSWGVRGFDYTDIVQPVLDRHCVACHSGPTPPKKVDLCGDKTDFFNVSYETLARGRRDGGMWDSPYIKWIPTYNGFESNILQTAPRLWGSPASKLTQILLSGHPDASGRPRIRVPEDDRRRLLLWMDLNVPYYGTPETAYPDNEGCRRFYPTGLDAAIADVARRRCVSCHPAGVPRQPWVRISHPERNEFLMAPLAKSSGGSGACGPGVFSGTSDPDYRAILRTFEPIAAQLARRPRMDMPGGTPDPNVSRSCQ